jgi:hypothetical protein
MTPHKLPPEGKGIYCRNHRGDCWAKVGYTNSPSCPQKIGWISNPILRFLFGWIPL